MSDTNTTLYPKHIAFIMDGNRRWAKKRGLEPWKGHEQGVETVRALPKWLSKVGGKGVTYYTLYTFSSENWHRSASEVKYLMKLLVKAVAQHLKEFNEEGVKLIVSGRIDEFSVEVQKVIKKAVILTKNNTKAVLNLALNYGGRSELVDAVKQIIADNIPADKIDEEMIEKHLYNGGQLPDPDLIIRTGGAKRTSNFLTWQSVYSELYFTETLWPDFSKKDLDAALRDFARRKRNFGH